MMKGQPAKAAARSVLSVNFQLTCCQMPAAELFIEQLECMKNACGFHIGMFRLPMLASSATVSPALAILHTFLTIELKKKNASMLTYKNKLLEYAIMYLLYKQNSIDVMQNGYGTCIIIDSTTVFPYKTLTNN